MKNSVINVFFYFSTGSKIWKYFNQMLFFNPPAKDLFWISPNSDSKLNFEYISKIFGLNSIPTFWHFWKKTYFWNIWNVFQPLAWVGQWRDEGCDKQMEKNLGRVSMKKPQLNFFPFSFQWVFDRAWKKATFFDQILMPSFFL